MKLRLTCDAGISGERGLCREIEQDENLVHLRRLRAEAEGERQLTRVVPDRGLDPLAIGIDEIDVRRRPIAGRGPSGRYRRTRPSTGRRQAGSSSRKILTLNTQRLRGQSIRRHYTNGLAELFQA